MRRTTQKEIEAILRLDGPDRFRHFIKRVVDEERAWGLWKDGWALMKTGDGGSVFPLWPAREYAEMCCIDEWASYEAEEIELERLMNELLPKLDQRDVRPGVFPTPGGKGVGVSVEDLTKALKDELSNYE